MSPVSEPPGQGDPRDARKPRSQVLWPLAFVTLTLGLIVVIVIGFVIIRVTAIPGDVVSGTRELARDAADLRSNGSRRPFTPAPCRLRS